MLKHLNAFINPEIILEKKKFVIQEYNNTIECSLTINGETRKTNIPLIVKKTTDTKYTIYSTFNIFLSNFEVKLPKLLFIPIADKIEIDVKLTIED